MRAGFVTAASQDWGLGFGPVTVGQERAKRAPDLWLPPPNLKPQFWRASNGARCGVRVIARVCTACIGCITARRSKYANTFNDLGLRFWG